MLKEIAATFITKMGLSTGSGGLGIISILGRPETGREEHDFPISALVFTKDSEAVIPKPLKRIGDTPKLGRTMQFDLYIYATDETELMDLIDSLHTIKQTYTGFVLSAVHYMIRYDETTRVEPDPDDPFSRFVTITPVLLTTI